MSLINRQLNKEIKVNTVHVRYEFQKFIDGNVSGKLVKHSCLSSSLNIHLGKNEKSLQELFSISIITYCIPLPLPLPFPIAYRPSPLLEGLFRKSNIYILLIT